MFSNAVAIETLIQNDSVASKREKNSLLRVLRGKEKVENEDSLIVRIKDAAYMLGLTRFAIYKAIRRGSLVAVYGSGRRATGVTRKSIDELLTGRRIAAVVAR